MCVEGEIGSERGGVWREGEGVCVCVEGERGVCVFGGRGEVKRERLRGRDREIERGVRFFLLFRFARSIFDLPFWDTEEPASHGKLRGEKMHGKCGE